MNIVKFTKMHGAGNDFILVDDRDDKFPIHDHRRIAAMATRRIGIGCEGVIVLQKSSKYDFKMLFFNSFTILSINFFLFSGVFAALLKFLLLSPYP